MTIHIELSFYWLGSMFENELMDYLNLHDKNLECWTDPDNLNNSLELEELEILHDRENIDLFHKCLTVVQELELTPEEQAILYGYLVVTAG